MVSYLIRLTATIRVVQDVKLVTYQAYRLNNSHMGGMGGGGKLSLVSEFLTKKAPEFFS